MSSALRPGLFSRVATGLLFLGVAAALAWSSDSSLGFGPDQIAYNIASQDLLKAWDRGETLVNDYGPAYRQSFAVMHAVGQRVLGSPAASYKLILFLSACAYLWSMFLLLSQVVESRAIAVLTTVLSIVQRYTIGTSFWGMGEFTSILPRIVVLAAFPLAWLLFERHFYSKRVLTAFVVAGLGVVLHLSSVYFYVVLLAVYGVRAGWLRERLAPVNLLTAAAFFLFALTTFPNPFLSLSLVSVPLFGALVASVGVWMVLAVGRTRRPTAAVGVILFLVVVFAWLVPESSLRKVLGNRASEASVTASERAPATEQPGGSTTPRPSPENGPPALGAEKPEEARRLGSSAPGGSSGEPTELEILNRSIYARFGWTLFPISVATLLFALFNFGLPGGLALYEYVRRWKKGPTEREFLVALFVVTVAAMSLGATAAIQLYCYLTGRPIVVLELFRALRLLYLPTFIYLGLFLQRVWRQSAQHRGIVTPLLLVALSAALLLPPRQVLAALPDRVKLLARGAVEGSGLMHPGDPSQAKYVRLLLATDAEEEEARTRYQDFLELCDWVRNSTPETSLFMTTDYAFAYGAERDIFVSYAQGAGSARSFVLESGYVAWHEAYSAVTGALESGSAERIMAVAGGYGVDYVVVDAEQAPLPTTLAFSNRSYSLYAISHPGRPGDTSDSGKASKP